MFERLFIKHAYQNISNLETTEIYDLHKNSNDVFVTKTASKYWFKLTRKTEVNDGVHFNG